jgi:nitroimidazol reductase NimA-like FMN-containing flavoprotein (pyridoxamine 5'-phosphate oxidase superfamily)
MEHGDVARVAREIVDSNLYMTLATADANGHPWASPVWYAHEGYTDFLWVSRPEARHSRNLASRPVLSIVIFDSSVPVEGARAVYLEATSEEVSASERERAIELYSQRSQADGAGQWQVRDVTAPAPHRLYRAKASEFFVLVGNDERISVDLASESSVG